MYFFPVPGILLCSGLRLFKCSLQMEMNNIANVVCNDLEKGF
jgi:hypothetical protein